MSDSPYAPTTEPLSKDEVVASFIVQNNSCEVQESHVASFVIDDALKNTAKNPNKEATITIPYLVKKTRSRDLLPRPWTSLTQLVAASYCSYLCCIISGVFANHYAWEALRYRDLGLFSEAKKYSSLAARFIYISFALGIILILTVPIVVVCGVQHKCG